MTNTILLCVGSFFAGAFSGMVVCFVLAWIYGERAKK